MQDKQISAACVVASGLWVAALAVLTVGWALGSPEVRCLSIIVAMAAATATIRTYFIEQNKRFKTALAAHHSVPTVHSLR